MKSIFIVVNTDWFFLLHRVQIVNSFKRKGFRITVITKDTGKAKEIEKLGFDFINLNFDRKGISLFKELNTVVEIFKIFKKNGPDLVYQVTIKPIIYGSIASRVLKIKNINTICGLGYVYSTDTKKVFRKIILLAYKNLINRRFSHTFFENKDDLQTFKKLNILNNKSLVSVVNGVGVDLKKFMPSKIKNQNEKIHILLATRMLWTKGVVELISVAKNLQEKYKGKILFKLYGIIDNGNREAITEEYLKSIEIKDYLKWYGFESNMVEVYKDSDIVVLPSYYGEGLPTVLAEACAMGLPIITTDSVGCRECVDEGINGFKVPVKSVAELAIAIEKLVLDRELRIKMGKASREKAERDFDQKDIISQYSTIFEKMLNE